MLSFFSKKEKDRIGEKKKVLSKEEEKPVNKTENVISENEYMQRNKVEKKVKKPDYTTEQCIQMGLDIKKDVEKSSHAFFNSKNVKKSHAYNLFEEYLETLESREISRIKDLTYLEFKEKEEQITTTLKNGFAQFLTKGVSLDDKNKEIVDFVFLDVKKYPSKGHRYWYFKEYIWQKRELD